MGGGRGSGLTWRRSTRSRRRRGRRRGKLARAKAVRLVSQSVRVKTKANKKERGQKRGFVPLACFHIRPISRLPFFPSMAHTAVKGAATPCFTTVSGPSSSLIARAMACRLPRTQPCANESRPNPVSVSARRNPSFSINTSEEKKFDHLECSKYDALLWGMCKGSQRPSCVCA